MKISNLEICNFLGIEKAVLNLDKNGITVIQGENLDSKFTDSNGAGKSSVYCSILYCLYGKTKRGLIGDDVINNTNKNQGCYVKAEIIGLDTPITILRSRNHTEHNTGLKVFSGGIDISKGTTALTQELIDGILKINYGVFEKIAFIGQGDIKPFASLSDRELKQVFEESLNLKCFSDTYEKLKIHKKNLESNKTLNEQSITISNIDMEKIINTITHCNEKKAYMAKSHDERMVAVAEIINNLQHEKESLLEKKKFYDDKAGMASSIFRESYLEDIAVIDNKIKQLNEMKDKLSTEINKKQEKKHHIKFSYDNANKTATSIKSSIDKAEQQSKEGCPACKRPFDKASIEKYIQELKDNYLKSVNEIPPLQDNHKVIESEIGNLNTLMSQINDKAKSLMRSIKQIEIRHAETNKEIETAERELSTLTDDVDRLDRQIQNQESSKLNLCNVLEEQLRAVDREILEKEVEVKFIREKIESLKAELTDIDGKLDISNYLEKALSNAGVKSYVFDSITPMLNKSINEFLSILDPSLSVEISTLKQLKSGELKEKFDIKVDNIFGSNNYYGNSGGEKAKINLAVALAFNSLIRKQSGSVINQIFLDEPFESLDDSAAENVVALLSAYAKDNSVFLISHNSAIKDIVSNKINVVKKNGKASVFYA